jgi:hypothetical protein
VRWGTNRITVGWVGEMDEGRKRVLLIAASILAARKLANWNGRPSPAFESAIADAITIAERIMVRIDARWPVSSERMKS